jgi:predicted RNA-binding protein with TRAM domain
MEGQHTKQYDIIVDGRTYILKLKKFDSNGDGKKNAIGFDVLPAVEPQEDEDEL